ATTLDRPGATPSAMPARWRSMRVKPSVWSIRSRQRGRLSRNWPAQLLKGRWLSHSPGRLRRRLSKPGETCLDRIGGAIEFAQISQPAHRQAMPGLLARLDTPAEILRHLGARILH